MRTKNCNNSGSFIKKLAISSLYTIPLALLYPADIKAATSVPDNISICDAAKNFDGEDFISSIGNKLFTKPEFNYYWGISDEDKRYLNELQNITKKYNINIVTLPIPYQAALYINTKNNPAPGKYDPDKANTFYQAQIKNLADHNLNPLDLSKVAKNLPQGLDFFANRDHHWTGPAMEVVAAEVKKLIDKLKINIDQSSETLLTKSMKDYSGSAADQLQKICGYKFSTQEQRAFYGLSIKSPESLLGTTNNDVVMVGDSYSISYFGFDKILSDRLKTPVLNMSINGGGCCSAINNYFANLKPEDPKPKVIIWTALMVLTNTNQSRELKPSIYQAYEKISALKEIQLRNTKSNIFQFKANLDKTLRYFIKINIDGPKAEDVTLNLNYETAKEDISLYRKNENQNTTYSTTFFYELKPGVGKLEDIKINLKQPGNVKISLFKYSKL